MDQRAAKCGRKFRPPLTMARIGFVVAEACVVEHGEHFHDGGIPAGLRREAQAGIPTLAQWGRPWIPRQGRAY
jgi:hypothetical protein